MPIHDRATSLLGALADAHEIGRRPFILIGHSLGGLLIKQIIRHCVTMGDQYTNFIDQLTGIIFFSTPHTGSGLVSLAKFLTLIRATPLVQELANNQPYLRELDDWYRNYVVRAGLPNLSFFETQLTDGLRVVDEVSGDPHLPGITAIPVDADHRSICKFSDRQNLIYRQALRFISTQCPTPSYARGRSGADSIVTSSIEDSSQTPATPLGSGNAHLLYRNRLAKDSRSTRQISATTKRQWSDPATIATFALTALVSEQLPSGGWTRSLAGWMTKYAQAAGTDPPDRPPMRVHGGIDVTCAAIRRLITVGESAMPELRTSIEPSLRSGTQFLRTRTPIGGAVGATIHTRTAPTEFRVRHTAITLSTLLRAQYYLGEEDAYPEAIRCTRYLIGALRYWRQDTSGAFGMLAATWDLSELLSHDGRHVLSSKLTDELQDNLTTSAEEIAEAIVSDSPSGSSKNSAEELCIRFGPYGGLSSLAKSSFLFGAKLLTSLRMNHRPVGLAEQRLYSSVLTTTTALAQELLESDRSREGLLTVPTQSGSRADIGLTAQFFSVLLDLLAVGADEQGIYALAASVLQKSIDNALMSADDTRITGRLPYTHGVQLSEVLDEPQLCEALVADPALPSLVSSLTGHTVSERYLAGQLVATLKQRPGAVGSSVAAACSAFGRSWTRVLEGGFYRTLEWQEGPEAKPWRLNPKSSDILRRVFDSWSSIGSSSTLWIFDDAEIAAGLVSIPGDSLETKSKRVTEVSFSEWTNLVPASSAQRFSGIYVPTIAVSTSEDLLLAALQRAAAFLKGSESEGVICIRLGDHRLISEQGEAIMFLADSSHFDRILHERGLRLIGIETTDETSDGVEAVARFRTKVGS
jgi:hypothetical protein